METHVTIREFVAEQTGSRVGHIERIQSLWSGYGELLRVQLEDDSSVIVKSVSPPAHAEQDVSYVRKCRSYEVEQTFYRAFAPRCDASCRVARPLGQRRKKHECLLVLEDLDAAGFAERHHDPIGVELDACLAWLASFHARFIEVAPEGLWKQGTYWHLATRRDDLARIRDRALRQRAPELDRLLREARFQTIVHGDAKPDNFCFSRDGGSVAAVDFQYVGGGCGMKDVAYLLYGTTPKIEARALDTYFTRLRSLCAVDADALEHEWRALYPVARDDFRRFLAGWRQ